MKLVILGLFFVLNVALVHAETITAITSKGASVILNEDGTWKYDNTKNASKKVINSRNKYFKIAVDTEKWRQAKSEDPSKMTFEHVDGDAYATILAERIGGVSIESLKEIALQNAQQVSTNLKITKEEKRTVNGRNMLCMQMEGIIQGIPFTYYGYYYAGKEGTLQVLTYTAQNLFSEYENEFTDFLEGTIVSSIQGVESGNQVIGK